MDRIPTYNLYGSLSTGDYDFWLDMISLTMITDHSHDQDVFVQVLDVSSCSSLSDNSLRALAHGCPQVP